MKKLRLLTFFLVFAASLVALQPLTYAQPAATAAPAVNASKPAAGVLTSPLPLAPLATQLGQTLQTLVVGSTSTQATQPADNGEDISGQITDTFATSVLDTLAKTVDALKANSTTLTSNASALPEFSDWLSHQSSDPHRVTLWSDISKDLLIIIGTPLLIGIAVALFLTPLRLKMKRSKPRALPDKIAILVALFGLRLLPIFVFLGASLLLLDQNETHRLPRFVILNVIYALSLGYTVQQLLRSVFAPTVSHLRPLPLTTPQAVSIYRWLSVFCFIIVYSYFLIDVATALRIPTSAVIVFQNLFALILTVMAVIVIFRTRAKVSAILRGDEEEEDPPSFGHAMRVWLAAHWHNLATAYLVISLAITLLGVENGFALMLRGTIFSIVLLVAARFGFVVIDQWKAPKGTSPALIHRQFLAFLLRPAIWVVAAVGIAAAWGAHVRVYLATTQGQHVFSAVVSITVTLFVLTVIYEMIHGSIERHLNRHDKITKLPVASARSRTLLPMMRTSVFILFSVIAVLTCLSSVGFNIAPLLAGAGVIGVAIGFGSQTLVKDFLTGLFIVIENTIAVGDIIKIGTLGGIVEALSIRTIRMRDDDGSLHIVPFSEVTKITNMTRGFAFAFVEIGVAYSSDLEHVMDVLHEIGAALQEDAVFKPVILEPIEVWGVESFGPSSINIRARIRVRPGKQWAVRRLLLLRIKQRFDKEGIEIPFPTTVVQIAKNEG